MKVNELISLLEEMNPELDVHFAAPSHDYWGNTLAIQVREIEESSIIYSEYHQEFKAITDDNDDELEDSLDKDNSNIVVLLS